MMRALRILHIASGDLWAGAEVQAFTLMSHLTRVPGAEIAAVLLNDGMLAAKLRSTGIEVHVIDERQIGAAGILFRLRRVLEIWRPDVVHTHRLKENILGALANRLGPNVPCVRTTHGGNERHNGWGARSVFKRAALRLDRWCGRTLQQRVVAVSERLGRDLASSFGADKVIVIENGIDAAAVRSEQGVAEFRAADPDVVHIGIIGRLVPVKRVDLFIGMAVRLKAAQGGRTWRFHVFGDGPLRATLGALAQRLKVADDVVFHGHREDIATCMGGLDVLVNCSDHEGMPMTALEASALGVPLVAHAVGGLPNVVPQEFLVVRHDAAGYGEGVLRALSVDARLITVRKAAAILEKYSAHRNAHQFRVLYEQLMGEAMERKNNR